VPACPVRDAIRPTWTTRRGRQPAHISCSTRRAGAIGDRGWGRDFDDPVAVPNGRKLVTLRDAVIFITRLPKAEHAAPEWLPCVGDLGHNQYDPQRTLGKDVFVHISAAERPGLSNLNEGAKVSYEEMENRGKTSAENLGVG
jgi:cold shock CspA family protein